jgi:hypothetical protein
MITGAEFSYKSLANLILASQRSGFIVGCLSLLRLCSPQLKAIPYFKRA